MFRIIKDLEELFYSLSIENTLSYEGLWPDIAEAADLEL